MNLTASAGQCQPMNCKMMGKLLCIPFKSLPALLSSYGTGLPVQLLCPEVHSKASCIAHPFLSQHHTLLPTAGQLNTTVRANSDLVTLGTESPSQSNADIPQRAVLKLSFH